MPHIFPRRFLRTRDILDPTDFNEDLQPAHDLLAGKLDRHNFAASTIDGISARIRPGPDSLEPFEEGPHVAEGAYFNIHTSLVEAKVPLYATSSYANRNPPNFVELSGSPFRLDHAGTNTDAKPFIVPNNGAWTAVENADLTAAEQITFTSGQTKLWVSAYAQYAWQGFYEYKPPYISGTKRFAGDEHVTTPDVGTTKAFSWEAKFGPEKLALAEQRSLNKFGPAKEWECLTSPQDPNNSDNIVTTDASYAWPLNESETAAQERRDPNRQGYHHISQGFEPCMVQFALRVDGKIIEETITGKNLPFEKSSHALVVTDSVPIKSDEDKLAELLEKLDLNADGDLDKDDYWLSVITGQRSMHSQTNLLPDSGDVAPGQKLRASRAVSCGPEVLPIRIGAVVSLEPGNHTVELVVRRLERQKGKFSTGDYVGVFSRRMLAFECPIQPIRQSNSDSGGASGLEYLDRFETPGFLSEDLLTDRNVSDPRERLAGQINSITGDDLRSHSLSNQYLPSKVQFSESVSLESLFKLDPYTGEYLNPSLYSSTSAVAPIDGDLELGDNILPDRHDGWFDIESKGYTTETVGWYKINNGDSPPLEIIDSAPGNYMALKPGERLVIFMDLELRSIIPIYSDAAEAGRKMLLTAGPDADNLVLRDYNKFVQYMLAERYLDLFALVAVGFKQDGGWNISRHGKPAIVNNFNWVNRGPLFTAYDNDIPMYTKGTKDRHWWDADLGLNTGSTSRWGGRSWYECWRNTNIEEVVPGTTAEIEKRPQEEFAHDGRGDRLFTSNLGINIPIMQVIENNLDTTRNITEVAGFLSSYVPDVWQRGPGPGSPRTVALIDDTGSITGSDEVDCQWASPAWGRDMLKGIRVRWGQGRLTVIKLAR